MRPPITPRGACGHAKASINGSYRSHRQLAFLECVLGHYVEQGVDELDLEKLSPLLRLKYHAISDAAADLGTPEQIRNVFIGFQKYLYQDPR